MGSVLGAPVLLRPSWFVIAAVVTVVFAPTVADQLGAGGPTVYLIAATFTALLLGSVFLHELAHAVAARFCGTPPTQIVLDLWGGHTSFADEVPTPGRSVVVAAAGPAVNGALAIVGAWAGRQLPPGVAALLLLALTISNAFVAVFNALPGLPLDGGRVLEGVVWWLTSDRSMGTLVAGWCGRGVSGLTAGYVVVQQATTPEADVTSGIWLLLIAGLLWQGAGQAIQLAQWRRRAPSVTVRSLLRPAVPVPNGATIADIVTAGAEAGVGDVVLLDVYGRPAAVVDRAAVATVPAERAADVPGTAVARALGPGATIGDDLAGEPLVNRLQETPNTEYAVVDVAGHVVGVLAWQDVAAKVIGR